MTKPKSYLPGTTGIWTFIFIDMLVFSALFLVFASERFRLVEEYARSQAVLNGTIGLVNTLILLTSSWVMISAVNAWRAGFDAAARFRFVGVIMLAAAFCVLKVLEYAEKASAGIGLVQNSFFTFYYIITGLHLLHVLGAVIFICSTRARMYSGRADAPSVAFVENIGLFWHFVDTLWVFIFPLLYLVGLR
jgi:nitric oxide reductase NorE protein